MLAFFTIAIISDMNDDDDDDDVVLAVVFRSFEVQSGSLPSSLVQLEQRDGHNQLSGQLRRLLRGQSTVSCRSHQNDALAQPLCKFDVH